MTSSSGIVIGGRLELVPGLEARSWHDDPALRLKAGEDFRRRPSTVAWIRAIVLHTTLGLPFKSGVQTCLPGAGPRARVPEATAAWWSKDGRNAGAQLVVDRDGSLACLADVLAEEAYHAGPVNPYTIGVEIAQGRDGSIYEAQLDAVAVLCEWLCRRLMIQRQVSRRELAYYEDGKLVGRCSSGGRNVVGVYGHRDVAADRGFGDPGDLVFARLEREGFEALDFSLNRDLEAWRKRQLRLGMPASACDGVPGPRTCTFVRQWQAAEGREVTGVLSELERSLLDSAE